MRCAHPLWAGSLARNELGGMALEFALVAPILLLMLFGVFEFARSSATSSALESAARAASRYGVTGNDTSGAAAAASDRQAEIRAIVARQTAGLVDPDKVTITTKAYSSFENIGKPEPWVDSNGNGTRDKGEWVDVNCNGRYDDDMGRADAGGTDEVVVYTLTYDEPLITTLLKSILGLSIRHQARVIVKNEPFPPGAPAC